MQRAIQKFYCTANRKTLSAETIAGTAHCLHAGAAGALRVGRGGAWTRRTGARANIRVTNRIHAYTPPGYMRVAGEGWWRTLGRARMGGGRDARRDRLLICAIVTYRLPNAPVNSFI